LKHRQRAKIALSVAVFCSCGLAGPTAAAAGLCVQIPAGVALPVVEACETERFLFWDIAGTPSVRDKGAYVAAFQKSLESWWEARGLDGGQLAGAPVELWLAMPEANPAATQARAVVTLPAAKLIVFLSPLPDGSGGWTLDDSSVGFLTDAGYPASFGYRTQQLLLKAKPGVDAEQVAALLARHGVTHGGEYSPSWYAVRVPPLQEAALKAALIRDPEAASVIARLDFNPLVEWIALRERMFAFSLSSTLN
jgi:hypothetical protein